MQKNLIFQHGNFFSWHNGEALYFVPEVLFLWILTHFFSNPYTTLILYEIIQVSWFCLLVIFLLKSVTSTNSGFRLGLTSTLIFFVILFIVGPFKSVYGHLAYFTTLFGLGFHFGVMLLSFTSFFLFIKILQRPNWIFKSLFILLLIVSGLSDPLFYLYFTAPLLLTVVFFCFLKKLDRKKMFFFISSLIICTAISYITYRLLPIQTNKINLSFHINLLAFVDFFKTIIDFILKNTFGGTLWLIFMIGAPIYIWKKIIKLDQPIAHADYLIFFVWITNISFFVFFTFSIGQVFRIISIPTSSFELFHKPLTIYNDLQAYPYRYFINFFVSPIVFGLPLLIYQRSNGIKLLNNNKYFSYTLGILITLLFIFKPAYLFTENLFSYQPKVVTCFDKAALQFGLKNGLSDDYYSETLINTYNSTNSHIALTYPNLAPLEWQTTSQMYQYPDYNFILSNNTNIEKTLVPKFGRPSHVVTCPDIIFHHVYLYIYSKPLKVAFSNQ